MKNPIAKPVTAIMPTGFLILTMIHVNSCNDPSPKYLGFNEDKKNVSLKLGLFHIEMDSDDGSPSEFFYDVTLEDLYKPLISKEKVKIDGSFMADKKLYEIWASPITSEPFMLKNNAIKKKLDRSGNFSFNLLDNTPYLITLNPFGLENLPPIFLKIERPKADQKYEILLDNSIDINGNIENNFMYNKKYQQEKFYAALFLGQRQISSLGILNKGGGFFLKVSSKIKSEDKKMPLILKIWTNNPNFILSKIVQKLEWSLLDAPSPKIVINDEYLSKSKKLSINVTSKTNDMLGPSLLYIKGNAGLAEISIKKSINKFSSIIINEILYGNYDIALVPNKNSSYGLSVLKDIKIDDNIDHVDMVLDKRQKAQILVLDFVQKPLAKAKVELSRIGKIGNYATEDIFSDRLFKLDLYTDDKGLAFTNRLDIGRYEVLVRPPSGSALSLVTSLWDFPREEKLTVILKKPNALIGQLLMPDGIKPKKFAFITIYAKSYGPFLEPKMIGQGMTDENGYFNILASWPHP